MPQNTEQTMTNTDTLIEEVVGSLKKSYFTTLKWCLKNQDLLAKPSHDSIWEKLWEDDFAQSIENELRTIASKSAEVKYKKALDDMFLEIYKLAEPDERQFGAGDLNTNMDEIHNIRVKLSSPKQHTRPRGGKS